MFYIGSLQNGITLALQQSKVVVCLITSANEQSKLWENEYLHDEEIISHLKAQAIVLRMDSSSQEAGYLAAFCPISALPAIVVINNGRLLADIHGSIPQYTFKVMLIKAVSGQVYEATAVTTSQISGQTVAGLPSGSSGPMVNYGSNLPSLDPAVQLLLNERSRRLEVDKKQKETAENSKQRAKREAIDPEAEATPESRHAKQLNYAQAQKRRQFAEQQERGRILRVIENDKLERKHKQEMHKALPQAGNETNVESATIEDWQISDAFSSPMATSTNRCAIQVRLFDGSTIRSSFNSNETLGTSVRRWIDQNRTDNTTPFNLKQIRAPMSSRSLTISEEAESLISLGLTPSATLIMVPIRHYAVAYDPSKGYFAGGVSAGNYLIRGCVSWISGAIVSLVGAAQNLSQSAQAAPATLPRMSERHVGSRNGVSTQTGGDHTGSDEQQFYNGNQLNFEPRKKDDEVGNERDLFND